MITDEKLLKEKIAKLHDEYIESSIISLKEMDLIDSKEENIENEYEGEIVIAEGEDNWKKETMYEIINTRVKGDHTKSEELYIEFEKYCEMQEKWELCHSFDIMLDEYKNKFL